MIIAFLNSMSSNSPFRIIMVKELLNKRFQRAQLQIAMLARALLMYDFHDSTNIFVNPSFLNFVPKMHPEHILVPKVAYDLPEFKIRPRYHIAIIHT